eukprot:7207543-Pyramimonas_sp.AAC.1
MDHGLTWVHSRDSLASVSLPCAVASSCVGGLPYAAPLLEPSRGDGLVDRGVTDEARDTAAVTSTMAA